MLSRFLTPLPRPELKASNESGHHLKSRKASSLPLHCQPPLHAPNGRAICYVPTKGTSGKCSTDHAPSQKPPGSLHQSREQSTNSQAVQIRPQTTSLAHPPKQTKNSNGPVFSSLVFLLPITHFLPLLPPHPHTLLSFQPESFIHEKVVSNSPTRCNLPVSGFPSPFFFSP